MGIRVVRDELHVEISSTFGCVSVFRDSNVHIDEEEVKVVNIGEKEVLILVLFVTRLILVFVSY